MIKTKNRKCTKCFCLVMLFSLAMSTGCQTIMTGIASSTHPITAADTYTTLGEATGTDTGILVHVAFIPIPVFPTPPSQTSTQRAIDNANADALIEVSQDLTVLLIPLIVVPVTFYIYNTRTKGTAVKINRGGALLSSSGDVPNMIALEGLENVPRL